VLQTEGGGVGGAWIGRERVGGGDLDAKPKEEDAKSPDQGEERDEANGERSGLSVRGFKIFPADNGTAKDGVEDGVARREDEPKVIPAPSGTLPDAPEERVRPLLRMASK
jgi:hypothetical protein